MKVCIVIIKIGIISAILVLGGLVFSSDINGLFPNTSESVIKSLKNDVGDIGAKASASVENRLDNSIDNVVDKTSEKINDEINDVKESSKEIFSKKISNINPIESISNIFKSNTLESSEEPKKIKTDGSTSQTKQNSIQNGLTQTNSQEFVYETLSLSTTQQPDDNILLSYSDSTGKTKSVNVTIRTSEKEIFSGTFYTPIFETIVNDASSTPYYVDMIVEHQDYGTVSSSVFNSGEHSDSIINGIFSQSD